MAAKMFFYCFLLDNGTAGQYFAVMAVITKNASGFDGVGVDLSVPLQVVLMGSSQFFGIRAMGQQGG